MSTDVMSNVSSTGSSFVAVSTDHTGAYVLIGIYMLFMLLVGVYHYRKHHKIESEAATLQRDDKFIEAHFLADRSFGPLVLTFTMFATLFSGYTVVGVPSETFRTGFKVLRWYGAVSVIVGMSVILYPRLRKLSIKYSFTSPTDFIYYRFGSEKLRGVSIFCMTIPTLLYLIAQFKSMNSTLTALTGSPTFGMVGTAILGILIFVIESLGGLKSVAFTDVLQASLLIFGFIMLPFLLYGDFGPGPPRLEKVFESKSTWFSTPKPIVSLSIWAWLLSMMSFPLYPHLLQRLYAAKTMESLKRMWTIMSFAPLITYTPAIMIGIYAMANIPTVTQPTQVFGSVTSALLGYGAFGYLIGSVILTASVAAIMSTADSALIAISNIITLDVYKRYINKDANGTQQLYISKIVSLVCITITIIVSGQKMNLSTLLEVQGGLLNQILPGFIFGLYTDFVGGTAILVGSIIGIIISLLGSLLVYFEAVTASSMILSSGLWALLANVVITVSYELLFFQGRPKGTTIDQINEQMTMVNEPMFHRFGRFHPLLALILSITMCPFFFTPGPVSLSSLVMGIPVWGIWMVIIAILWMIETVWVSQLWSDPNEFEIYRSFNSVSMQIPQGLKSGLAPEASGSTISNFSGGGSTISNFSGGGSTLSNLAVPLL